MTTKHCPRCKQDLPRANFARRSASPDGLQGRCRACVKVHASGSKVNGKYQKLTAEQWAAKRSTCNTCESPLKVGQNWRACDHKRGHYKCAPCTKEQDRAAAEARRTRQHALRHFKTTHAVLTRSARPAAEQAERMHVAEVQAQHAAVAISRDQRAEAMRRYRQTHCRDCGCSLAADNFTDYRRSRADYVCNECHHVDKVAASHEQRARASGSGINEADRPIIRAAIRAVLRLNRAGTGHGLPVLGLDHVVPLGTPGGEHAADNLMILPNALNGAKGTAKAAEVADREYRKWLDGDECALLAPWLMLAA